MDTCKKDARVSGRERESRQSVCAKIRKYVFPGALKACGNARINDAGGCKERGETSMLQGKTILLGISGGIAAYKAATICSRLVQAGANVRVIMTESATKFITPLTLQTLSRHPVYLD